MKILESDDADCCDELIGETVGLGQTIASEKLMLLITSLGTEIVVASESWDGCGEGAAAAGCGGCMRCGCSCESLPDLLFKSSHCVTMLAFSRCMHTEARRMKLDLDIAW